MKNNADEARRVLWLPPLRSGILGSVVDAFMMRNDPVRECRLYRDKGCCHVDGILCDFPVCDMNQDYCGSTPASRPTIRSSG